MAAAIGITLLILVVATLLALTSHSISPRGPQIYPEIRVNSPTVKYTTNWAWYNFSIIGVTGPFSWSNVTVLLENASPTPLDQKSTLSLLNRTAGTVFDFARSPGWNASESNWTIQLPIPVEDGQELSLKVDYAQTRGFLTLVWTSPVYGSYGLVWSG